jgi:hypothetical protein
MNQMKRENGKITWDIETVPLDLPQKVKQYYIKKNLKIDDSADIDIENLTDYDYPNIQEALRNYKLDLSLTPTTAKIVCLGFKINNGEAGVLTEWRDTSEETILKRFWYANQVIYDQTKRIPLWVTKNGKGFDALFVMVRSSINKVPIPEWLRQSEYLRRYSYFPHFDIQEFFSNYNFRMTQPLNIMAECLGVPYINSSGGQVEELYRNGDYTSIETHCISDVNVTDHLYTMVQPYAR